MRRTKPATAETAALLAIPHIHPDMVFTRESFLRTFGLRQSSLRREVREGRLKVQKRCGKYFILGSEVLNWLRGGDYRSREQAADLHPRRRPIPPDLLGTEA
jgi:hypothetical protein